MRITVVASMRNEGPFIVEWVTWYRMLGFTDVVVVTNDCTDHSPELLDALERAGWVSHMRCDVPPGQRITARKLKLAKSHRSVRRADWVMVCDVDEFLVIHRGDGLIGDLIDLSAPDPGFLGMSINWRVFGTGKVQRFEDRPVHRQFVYAVAASDGLSVQSKAIFRKPRAFAALAEHGPRGLRKRRLQGEPIWVNSSGEAIATWTKEGLFNRSFPWMRVTHAAAQINHYMLRSSETYRLKEGTPAPVNLADRYTPDYFHRADRADELDVSAFHYAPRFEPLFAQAMALPDVARLHLQCCADHLRLIAEKTGGRTEDDPRQARFLAAAKEKGAADGSAAPPPSSLA